MIKAIPGVNVLGDFLAIGKKYCQHDYGIFCTQQRCFGFKNSNVFDNCFGEYIFEIIT
jgi:hypothetical protein